MTAVHISIHGRVQGVGYRLSAQRRARDLGLSGWVANRPDGSVEALVQGAEPDVRAFIAWAHHGPAAARVDRVQVQPVESIPGRSGFTITA